MTYVHNLNYLSTKVRRCILLRQYSFFLVCIWWFAGYIAGQQDNAIKKSFLYFCQLISERKLANVSSWRIGVSMRLLTLVLDALGYISFQCFGTDKYAGPAMFKQVWAPFMQRFSALFISCHEMATNFPSTVTVKANFS